MVSFASLIMSNRMLRGGVDAERGRQHRQERAPSLASRRRRTMASAPSSAVRRSKWRSGWLPRPASSMSAAETAIISVPWRPTACRHAMLDIVLDRRHQRVDDHDPLGEEAETADWQQSAVHRCSLCRWDAHVILDMAMSVAARGKIRAAQKAEGIADPGRLGDGWVGDTDHGSRRQALAGFLLPVGGHKGSGTFDGGGYPLGRAHGGDDSCRTYFILVRERPTRLPGVGHFFLLIDPDKLLGSRMHSRQRWIDSRSIVAEHAIEPNPASPVRVTRATGAGAPPGGKAKTGLKCQVIFWRRSGQLASRATLESVKPIRISFARLILAARYVEPPRSGWFFCINRRCASMIILAAGIGFDAQYFPCLGRVTCALFLRRVRIAGPGETRSRHPSPWTRSR